MYKNQVARLRLRYSLILVILATLPCYCAGLIVVNLAPQAGARSTATPTLPILTTRLPGLTLTLFPSFTPFPSWTSGPTTTGTLIPSPSSTVTISPSPSLTPFLPPTASDTVIPPPTDTLTPGPTATGTPVPPSATAGIATLTVPPDE